MLIHRFAIVLLTGILLSGLGRAQTADSAEALRQGFAAAREHSTEATFDRPVYLQSVESSDRLQGDVYAVVNHPYELVRQTLVKADNWCGILILHLNVHYCRSAGAAPHQTLDAGLGRKLGESLDELYWFNFSHSVTRSSADYLAVALQAPTGPLSTRDYRIVVEAAPQADKQTLLHFRYAYGFGVAARLAMGAYLATAGANKVGFSSVGQRADGEPIRVGGVRGVLERNTMRYYLAIESYLGALGVPPAKQLQKSLVDWFVATERYPQQLHEVDREAYLDMKQREVNRQEAQPPPAHN